MGSLGIPKRAMSGLLIGLSSVSVCPVLERALVWLRNGLLVYGRAPPRYPMAARFPRRWARQASATTLRSCSTNAPAIPSRRTPSAGRTSRRPPLPVCTSHPARPAARPAAAGGLGRRGGLYRTPASPPASPARAWPSFQASRSSGRARCTRSTPPLTCRTANSTTSPG